MRPSALLVLAILLIAPQSHVEAQRERRVAVLGDGELGQVGGTGAYASVGGQVIVQLERTVLRARIAKFGSPDGCAGFCTFDDADVFEGSLGYIIGSLRDRWSAGVGAGVMNQYWRDRRVLTAWPYVAHDWRLGLFAVRAETRVRRFKASDNRTVFGPSLSLALGIAL